ncbi:MAG: polyprenyl synthetase family protein [Candidatus Woesearchaeota archaeon]
MKLPYKKEIEDELRLFFKQIKKDVKFPEVLGALDKLEDYTMRGGKRIRAILIVVGYLACGGKNIKEIVKVSTSAELLQSFLLIHDDIIDEDDLRRGGSTVHASFRQKYNQRISESLAMITGDLSICYTLEPVLNSSFSDSLKLEAIREIMNTTKTTCFGQILDEYGELKEVDEKFVESIQINKTANYTIAKPLVLGAKLAGASNEVIEGLSEFGLSLGRAFQIRDDILGVFGDEKKLGKPVGSDLVEGKKTLLIIRANSKFINSMIGKDLNEKEIEKIREIIISSGSLYYSKKLIEELIEKAKKALDKVNIKSEQKKFLMEIADYIGKREN